MIQATFTAAPGPDDECQLVEIDAGLGQPLVTLRSSVIPEVTKIVKFGFGPHQLVIRAADGVFLDVEDSAGDSIRLPWSTNVHGEACLTVRSNEPPWEDLDPGVVEMVRLLWDSGFEPTDSGDGESKEGALDEADAWVQPQPHVYCVVPRHKIIAEADRCWAMLVQNDLASVWFVEASYSPAPFAPSVIMVTKAPL